MSIYEESGFSSPEELEATLAAASAELNSVHAGLKAVESRGKHFTGEKRLAETAISLHQDQAHP